MKATNRFTAIKISTLITLLLPILVVSQTIYGFHQKPMTQGNSNRYIGTLDTTSHFYFEKQNTEEAGYGHGTLKNVKTGEHIVVIGTEEIKPVIEAEKPSIFAYLWLVCIVYLLVIIFALVYGWYYKKDEE